jgi:hypothetical protein
MKGIDIDGITCSRGRPPDVKQVHSLQARNVGYLHVQGRLWVTADLLPDVRELRNKE